MNRVRALRVGAGLLTVATALALAGCASGSASDASTTVSDGPVTLEYWSWATNVDQVAAVVLLQHAIDTEKSTGRPTGSVIPTTEEPV